MVAILLPCILFAQYPTPLTEANFPSANDSITVKPYTIPATQAFIDDDPLNDSLSLDRTLEKAIQTNNALDPMHNIAVGGHRNDTIAMFYYMGFAVTPFVRRYNAYNGFYPGAANFPTATLHTIIPSSEGDAHTYFRKDATGFYELGFFVNTTSGAMTSINTPAKPVALFPVDFASPNNVTNMSISNITSVPGTTINTASTLSITVDAYGDVTIVDGSISSPVYTTHTNYLRLCTHSDDNMDLGSSMNYFIESKIYAYYVASRFEPVATYSVAQIRSNIEPMYWGMGLGQWEDEIEFAYSVPIATGSVEEQENSYFNIFPNPTDGLVQVNFSNMPEEQISIDIYDMQGKLAGSYQRSGNSVEFDMTNYPSGTYVVHLKINDRVFPSRIVKK